MSVRSESRSPAYLAALASAAVPGLDPAAARAVRAAVSADFDVAFVTDTQDRRWVVRVPRTPMAGARMENSVALLALLARRVPFQVPVPKGFTDVPEGRAAVYPYLPGTPLRLGGLPAGPGLAGAVGTAIAALHNVDRRLYDEAGLPSYDSDAYRARRLADIDRGAATGQVPSALLSRWENALEDVTLWRFAPTPIHGDLGGEQLLAVFASDLDAATGTITGVTGWEDAKVADPADDFATLVDQASPAAVESVLEAYAAQRTEPADPQLLRRARLAGELRLLARLLAAVTASSSELTRGYAAALRRLDDRVDPRDLQAPAPTVVAPKPVLVAAPAPAASPAPAAARVIEPGATPETGSASPGGDDLDDDGLELTQPMPPGSGPDPLPPEADATQELRLPPTTPPS